MAVDNDDFDLADDDEAAGKKGGKKKWLWIGLGVAGLLLIVGLSVGLTMMLSGSESAPAADAEEAVMEEAAPAEGEADKAEPAMDGEVVYHSLQPPFVVNFSGNATARFLQVGIDVSARDESVIEDVQKHNPVIRNNIVLLLSTQDQATLMTREGKEKLRADVQAEIQRILKEHTGRAGIESVYFTSFVMQ